MGLNLDVDHVAFAQDRKYDGYQFRNLNPGELAQIAGRAGRHLRDGTFGVTSRVEPFDNELVHRIESHQFDPVRVLQWRSKSLSYASIQALKKSLDAAPAVHGLTRALPAVDQQALDYLSLSGSYKCRDHTGACRKALGGLCASRLPAYNAGATCRSDFDTLCRSRPAWHSE
jgi:hypothetical protein